MRSSILVLALAVGSGLGSARAACPPDLLNKMVDQGYSKDEVLKLCGDDSHQAPSATNQSTGQKTTKSNPEIEEALAKLTQLTMALDGECKTDVTHSTSPSSPCTLSGQYHDILVLWRDAQKKCSSGNQDACRTLKTAADQFLSTVP